MLRDQEGNTIEVKGTPMASNNHRLILGNLVTVKPGAATG